MEVASTARSYKEAVSNQGNSHQWETKIVSATCSYRKRLDIQHRGRSSLLQRG